MALEITVDTDQARAVGLQIEKLPRRFTRNVAEALRITAKETAQQTRAVLRRRGSGAPSRPGEPPAFQTGNLARSIRFRGARRDRLAYTVAALASSRGTAYYGRFLETGTKRGLLPRPYLTTQQKKMEPVALKRIASAVEVTFNTVNAVGGRVRR